jgi:hypothetical protein
LRRLIEAAYSVFAPYQPRGRLVDVCLCNVCCTEAAQLALSSPPLRAMSSALISEYTNSAHAFDPAVHADDLRWLLPRYMELIALDDPPHYGDFCSCLRHLGAAEYRSRWPQAEVQLIDDWLDELLLDKLDRHRNVDHTDSGTRLDFPIADLLEMMVLAGAQMPRVLGAFDRGTDPAVGLFVATLVQNLHDDHGLFAGDNVYMTDAQRLEIPRIAQWCRAPRQVERIRAAIGIVDDPGLKAVLSHWV